jgi:hypothetical protein
MNSGERGSRGETITSDVVEDDFKLPLLERR